MVQENIMKEQLALAVRSIQWSYIIFWSESPHQTGVLSWGEGYYNGEIKTRKTNQEVELSSDEIGLQRSEQLRELFRTLKPTETSPPIKKPSAALSPDDLTDTEWYYLVCMSFVFNIGQGLPGRALANDEPIWLMDADSVDCKEFNRSLLAKTVVCFPFMKGVIELGTTDMVMEDLSIIQQVKTSLSNILSVDDHINVQATLNLRNNEDVADVEFDHIDYNVELIPEVGYDIINTETSPNGSSNALQTNQLPPDETFMVESWQIMDDDLIHNSMNSSDCISQTIASVPRSGEDCNNNQKMTLVDPLRYDCHYQKILSDLLTNNDQITTIGMHFQNFHQDSSFCAWNKRVSVDCQRPRQGNSQKLLKKMLLEVPRMHMDGLVESQEENDYREGTRLEADEGMNHVLSERRRRAKLNERFLTLRSMVPSNSKDDKVSILDDAIEYLSKLEKKIKELEAQKEPIDIESRSKKSHHDLLERTCDDYYNNKTNNGKKPMMKKRKICDIGETRRQIVSDALKGSSNSDVTVSMSENGVVIEMKCPSREGRILEIMDAVNNLNMDFNSVQSTDSDGRLHVIIRSKFKGPANATTKRIKQALQKVASKF
ncbi:endoglucanase 3 [Trifolium repens]|nr:endoglucanase 3 [Trifolium repens]